MSLQTIAYTSVFRVDLRSRSDRSSVRNRGGGHGDTVRAALDAYFAEYPAARSYVLDDAGAVRKHVAVFHNDDLIVDRSRLSDAVADGDRLQIFQALSGG
jgi:sulfur carrier protein ThiS